MGDIHTACQDTGDLHNVKKTLLYQDNAEQILSPSCISQGECVIQGYPYILDKKNN